MKPSPSHHFLHGRQSTLLLKTRSGAPPEILYWGARLSTDVSVDEIVQLQQRQTAMGGPLVDIPITLSCETGSGHAGAAGLEVHRDGKDWATALNVKNVITTPESLTINCKDEVSGVAITYHFAIDRNSDVICIETTLTNAGRETLNVNWLSAVCIPVPTELCDAITCSGRWAHEFQTSRTTLDKNSLVIENRRGRTSHDRFPGVILCAKETTEQTGPCLGAQLGWSGNARTRVDTLNDGRRVLQSGELLLPGEIRFTPGAQHAAPKLYISYAPSGLSQLSQNFHDFYHRHLQSPQVKKKPRPVHYNTWEAIYFDHSPEKVIALADTAADLGVERFVLDDGWFKGRRNDWTGLGDWTVDPDIYPEGLRPIIDHVKSKNMEFGLWVEPEMVNEDSDLYRKHPDWVMAAPPRAQTPMRNQLVLDLTRKEVAEYIYNRIDALLDENDIRYLKWDANRDLTQPGNSKGAPAVSIQIHALYGLIDKLRNKHPDVEIESCASGGGRTDFGILERTDRLWTSDSNDAIDRQLIQRGASYFFPLSILGVHIGPKHCHITGRTLSASMRAATAIFGHMGVEADILSLDEDDRTQLKSAIEFYKENRALIHGGRLVRLDHPDHQNAFGIIANDQRRAVYSFAQLGTCPDVLPGVIKFHGLDQALLYRLRVGWPTSLATPYPHFLEQSELVKQGYEVSGDALINVGLQLPQLFPENCIIFKIEAV